MAAQLYSILINDINPPPERFQRTYYLTPPEVGFAYGLLRQICVMDSEYPSEQINSLCFDTADLDQHARSL